MHSADAGAGSAHPDDAPEAGEQPQLTRRHRYTLAGATAVAALAVGGLVGSMWVRSPGEVAADTAAPPPDVLTAPVQDTVLSSTVILSGTFTAVNQVSASPVGVAATAGNPGGGPMVVTGVFVAAGDTVTFGRPLIEYSGRPVYALPGAIPAYRDMVPGESGRDIAQLQHALGTLGFSCGWDAPSVFGPGTADAVTRFYQAMGYAPPTTGSAAQLAVDAARQAYDQQSAVVRQLEASSAAGSPSVLAQAKQTLQADAAALAQAEAGGGPMVPMSEALFVPQNPAVVQSVSATVGEPVAKQPITLIDGGVQLTGRLDPADAALLKPGMKAEVTSQSGLQAAATVAAVGTATVPPTPPATGDPMYDPVSITPDQPWDASLYGQNVRITVTEATTRTPVLAVPEAAISTGADGRTTVTVLDASGARHAVQVRAGVSANGLVAVTPLDADLTRGQQVVIGP